MVCLHRDECCSGVENKMVVVGLTKLFLFATVNLISGFLLSLEFLANAG